MGGWGWEQRVADSYWARQSAFGGTRLLDSVAEWPGMTSKFGKKLFQEDGSSRWVQRLFKSLHQAKLISGEEAGRSGFRYSVCSTGFNLAGPQGPGEQFQAAVRGASFASCRWGTGCGPMRTG